jgi:hypothetical protein
VQCSAGQHDTVDHHFGQWLVGYDRLTGSRREGSKEGSVAETARSSGIASNPVPVQKTSTEEGGHEEEQQAPVRQMSGERVVKG